MRHLTDLRTLTAFVTVAREGNVTRASELLHLTQPAVTLQLKRLSEACGVQLFRRTGKGLELTQSGIALSVKAEAVLSAMAEFDHSAQNLQGVVQGRIRIGTIIDPDFTRLGAFLAELTRAAPGLETELVHGVSGDVLARILRDELDVGFYLGDLSDGAVSSDPTSLSKIHQQHLANFSYYVVAPPGWDKKVRGKGWAELAQLPWIGTHPSSVHHRLLHRIFQKYEVVPHVVARVDQELSMLAMVRSGIGLSLCRDSLALFERQTKGLAIADQVDVETSLSFLCMGTRLSDPKHQCVFEAVTRAWIK
jgi:DNA-binding transcriptional LysR family regulator